MSPGPKLDKNSIYLLDHALLLENYAKLFSDAKHLKTSLSKGW